MKVLWFVFIGCAILGMFVDSNYADLSTIVESEEPERIATGFQFTEGPVCILMDICCLAISQLIPF
jgi:hypothetical protein